MTRSTPESIAIIGMSCRFPAGANNPEKYWQLLSDGRDGWSKVPADRWNEDAFYHPDPSMNGATNHRGGYFIDQDIGAFDPVFFGISGEEAKSMDPQQRLQLEIAYESLENAGLSLESLQGSATAVYTALFSRDYDRLLFKDMESTTKYHMIGTGDAILSNRISHVFDFRGPSMTIDTGCSGSLVAMHQACQSLRTGESNLALVGASNLILSPDQLIPMSLSHFLNKDGHCYSFDARGEGYGRGEGVAMVVLKRLEDALLDGDHIRAIVRNSGVGQDGKTASGITAPSAEAQEDLIRSVYAEARLDPRTTAYLEAHGTGTKLGDVAELKSTRNVFSHQDRKQSLMVASAKSNIGHLESASGLAGLMKTVLMFESGLVPPSIHFNDPKPELNYNSEEIQIPTQLSPLKFSSHGVCRASINGFGYGGTNAHVIIDSPGGLIAARSSSICKEDPTCFTHHRTPCSANLKQDLHSESLRLDTGPMIDPTNESSNVTSKGVKSCHAAKIHDQIADNGRLLVLSARSEISLRLNLKALQDWTKERAITEQDLEDLSHTLCVRRSAFPWRTSLVVDKSSDLSLALSQTDLIPTSKSATDSRIIFVFTGQGAQWAGMGQELLQVESEFSRSIERSDAILKQLGARYSLVEELCKPLSSSLVNESWLAQAGTTALQIALVDLLRSFRVNPFAVVGHSSGEIAAAYSAGVFSQREALKVSYYRGCLPPRAQDSKAQKGAMLAVGLSESDAQPYVTNLKQGKVAIACINAPSSVTISGDEGAIEELREILNFNSTFNRRLKVDTAYHSHHMLEPGKHYVKALSDLEFGNPRVKFISSVTAKPKTDGFGPEYWAENLTSLVRFSDALTRTLESSSSQTVIEIGPHNSLLGPIRQTVNASGMSKNFRYIPTLSRGESALNCLLKTAGKVFEIGHAVDFASVCSLGSRFGRQNVISDLPPYSWDHSNSYWHETRYIYDHKFRKHAYHDLLGRKVIGTAPSELVWRNFLSLDSHPWLGDHIIENAAIYPAAGYLCMAIEAIRQVAQEQDLIAGLSKITLEAVSFTKALVIPDDRSRVEIILTLRMGSTIIDKSTPGWESFQISTVTSDGTWSEHCHGKITLELEEAPENQSFTAQQQSMYRREMELFKQVTDCCSQSSSLQSHYSDCESVGNIYGPTFQLVEDIKTNEASALAKVRTPDIATIMPYQRLSPHIVHPTTLDNLLQVSIPLFHRLCSKGAVMPTYLEELSISKSHLSAPGTTHEIACSMTPTGQRSAIVDIVAMQRQYGAQTQPTITIRGQEMTGVGDVPSSEDLDASGTENTVYRVEWKPDITLCDPQEEIKVKECTEMSTSNMSFAAKDDILEQAAAIYVDNAINNLSAKAACVPKVHHQKLMGWMKAHIESHPCKGALQKMSASKRKLVLKECRDLGVEGEALTRIGEALPLLLSGDVEPLSVLLENDMLYRLYLDDASTQCYLHMQSYLERLAFKKSHMKVLEIGAGTGETTSFLLQAHSANSDSLFQSYDYTDISSGFFDNAKSKLNQWSSLLQFKTLDIEKEPKGQGFEELAYDLVIATNVIHATAKIDTTLKNVNKLLKPSGQFLLLELVNMRPYLMLIYGILPGWWSGSNDGREVGPILNTTNWASRLQAAGFSYQAALDDMTGKAHRCSVLVSDKLAQPAIQSPTKVSIIGDFKSDALLMLSTLILRRLTANGFATSLSSWPSKDEIQDSIYIVLDVGERPLFTQDQHNFHQVSALLTSASRLLWVDGSLDNKNASEYRHGLSSGLIRTARSENGALHAASLSIEPDISSGTDSICSAVCDILIKTFADAGQLRQDLDYTLKDGKLFIPRLLPEISMDRLKLSSSSNVTAMASFHQQRSPLKLHVEKVGLLDTLIFHPEADLMERALDPDEIRIQVLACGVNFKDVFISLGQMKATTTMAGECAGVVTDIGTAVPNAVKVGDRVCAVNATPYASIARVHHSNAITIPEDMSFTTAASIPIVFATAYEGLINVARLQRGQTVFVTAASGGVGQAAIQIAQHVGATVYAAVGSTVKRDLLIETFKLDSNSIFSSRSRRLKKALMQMTNQHGVDVVLNATSGETLADLWSCLAPFGTFVEIGKTDIYRRIGLSMATFDRNTTFAAVDLSYIATHKPARIQIILASIMKMFQAGQLSPARPVNIMRIGEVETAFRLIQGRKHTGKIVLDAGLATEVKAVLPSRHATSLKLHSYGTYIVAGGLGDLGRHVSRSMARHGAGNIALLSRRQLSAEEEKQLKAESKTLGTNIHLLRTDISSYESVNRAIGFCKAHLPPIMGLVQAAMVLQDRSLSNMSFEVFEAALKPKIDGTIHLLNAIKGSKLDFVLLLSSLSSVLGTPGQANYSAANSYLDRLGQVSTDPDLPILTLNLGMVEDTSIIKEKSDIVSNLLRSGYFPLKVEEFISLFEYLISSETLSQGHRQIAVGTNGASIQGRNTALEKHAMFQALFRSVQDKTKETSKQTFRTLRDVVLSGMEAEKIHDACRAAIKQRIASLVAIDASEIADDCPVKSLGMDSLIITELKNWISKESKANLVTSEITDSADLDSLTSLILQRSSLVKEQKWPSEKTRIKEEQKSAEEQHVAKAEVHTTKPNQHVVNKDLHREKEEEVGKTIEELTENVYIAPEQQLTTLPLPKLKDTLEFFGVSARLLCSVSETETLTSEIKELLKPGGTGEMLQSRLIARTNDPSIKDWQNQLYVDYVYLRVRSPVYPFQTFTSYFPEEKPRHSQAERAAVLTLAASAFERKLRSGSMEVDYLNEEPLDMSTSQWIFGAVREAHVGVDTTRRYGRRDYVVALRKGHVFKIVIEKEDKSLVSFAALKAAFENILSQPLDEAGSIAARARIQNDFGPANRKHLQTIEAAPFAVCLDDAAPTGSSESANHFLLSPGTNRWSDKVMQLIICANTASGALFEHSMVDGSTLGQLNHALAQAILSDTPTSPSTSTPHLDAPAPHSHLSFSFPALSADIARVHHAALETSRRLECQTQMLAFPGLGHALFRAHGCTGKAGLQLTLQLASRLYFGPDQPASWETVTMRSFAGGRVDIAQTLQGGVKEWCEVAVREYGDIVAAAGVQTGRVDEGEGEIGGRSGDDKGDSRGKVRAAFQAAAREHVSNINRVARGHGFAGHLYALQEMQQVAVRANAFGPAEEGSSSNTPETNNDSGAEVLPALFRPGSTFWRTRPHRLMTDSGSWLPMPEGCGVENHAGFTLPFVDSVFFHYEAGDQDAAIFVKCPAGQLEPVKDALGTAVEIVRAVLKERPL